jgi:hypothetical protein
VKRFGTAATLRSYTASGEDAYGDPTDYAPVDTATFALVVEQGGAGTVLIRDAKGQDRVLDAEVYVPDDLTVMVEGVDDLPEIDVGGRTFQIVDMRHKARPGLHKLMCEKMRARA